jgi:peptide deformylase
MIRDVLKMGDPRLLRVARPVTDFGSPQLRALIDDLFDTMAARDGAGIAAPQIGIDLRVVIFGIASHPNYPDADAVPQTVLINPVIEALSPHEEEGWEGCLSVPGMRGWVPRFSHIRYRGHDANGQSIDRTASDFHARVVQHECDHLDGTLYPRRIRDLTRFGFTEVLFPGRTLSDD